MRFPVCYCFKNYFCQFALAAFLLLFAASVQTAAQCAKLEVLNLTDESNQTARSNLKLNECHLYELNLEKDEFVRIEVKQRGVDVELEFFRVDGKTNADSPIELFSAPDERGIFKINSPNGTADSEYFVFLVPTTGKYKLKIKGLVIKGFASKGNYLAEIAERRPATPNDKKILAAVSRAERLFKKAEVFSLQNTGKTKQQAIPLYQQAFDIYQTVEPSSTWQKYRAALIAYRLGGVFVELADNKNAVKVFRQAIELGEMPLKVKKSEPDRCPTCKMAPSMLSPQRFSSLNGWSSSDLGLALYRLGDYRQADAALASAVRILQSQGEKTDLALAYTRHSLVLTQLGRKNEALQSAEIADSIDPVNSAAKLTIRNNLALVYTAQTRRREALKILEPLADEFIKLNKFNDAATVLLNTGNIYETLKQPNTAKQFFKKALGLAPKMVDSQRTKAFATANLGRLEMRSNKNAALTLFGESLRVFQSLKDADQQATVFNFVGMTHHFAGDYKTALENYEKARRIFETTGNRIDLAQVLNNTGAALSQINEPQKALELYQATLHIELEGDLKSSRAETLHNLMQLWKTLKNPHLSVLYGKQSVNLYKQLRGEVQGLPKEIQKSFLTSKENTYRNLAGILIEEERIVESEQVLAMLKEEEFFEYLLCSEKVGQELRQTAVLTPAEREAVGRYNRIANEIVTLSRRWRELEDLRLQMQEGVTFPQQARLDELYQQLRDAKIVFEKYLETLKNKFGENDVRVAKIDSRMQGKLIELKNQGVDVSRTVSVSTIVDEQRLYLIVTTTDVQKPYIIDIPRIEVNRLVAEFRAAAMNPQSNPRPAGQKLYDLLIKPIENDLTAANADLIVWSLDGTLRYAPVAAIWDKEKGFLVERFAGVVVPFADADKITADKKPLERALGLGVSEAFEDFSALFAVPQELDCLITDSNSPPFLNNKCQRLFNGRKFLDGEFTKNAFESNISRFQLIHISSHFNLKPGSNADSFLLLGGGDPRRYGLDEIGKLRFDNVELLTLSACNTATPNGSNDIQGDEIESFAALTQKKGAKSVLATLWAVADDSTTDFVLEFYQNYQTGNLNKAQALRQAQRAFLPDKTIAKQTTRSNLRNSASSATAKYAHPYFWSPFVLFGNWK